MFFEKNKILIRFFLFVIRHKIRVNANHFKKRIQHEIDLNKIDYIYFRLEKFAIFRFFFLISIEKFIIIKNFFSYIQRFFENSNFVFTTQIKIRDCKQKNRFFNDYFSKFQMYIENIDYNEIVARIVFFDDFFIEIKKYLIFIFWRHMNIVFFQKKMRSFENCL